MANVDVVIPVYNEQAILAESIAKTLAFLEGLPRHEWRLVIADNASIDRTPEVARALEAQYPGKVVPLHIPVKGRGIALRTAWLTSEADVVSYMDVDLSTDLRHVPELIDPIAAGEVDLAYGTRLHRRSEIERSIKREITSRGYVLLLRYLAGLRVTDAQCGFKAISREAARELVPLVKDTQWFFDSELLLIAQKNGYRLREVPVRWIEDRDSRVNIIKTVREDLEGIWRMRRDGVPKATRGGEGEAA